jgi:type I restriction enzyme S subunit
MRSGQPGINGNEYAQLPIELPSIAEQTAIASVLSDMDNDIESLESTLAKAREIKQGMMEELLTGRIRLV